MTHTWFCIDCRVPMKWQEAHQKCPECGAEVWYPDGDKRPDDAARALRVKERMTPHEYISRSYIPGTCGPGGSDPVGSTKTHKMQHPTAQKEYERLFKQT